MNREELQQLERQAIEILSGKSDIDPDTLSALANLHHDERVLGEVMWAVRGSSSDPRTAIAPIIRWLGQTRTGSYSVGDFQRLLTDVGGRDDHGHVGTRQLVWNHALESMVEKLGRETLMIDVKDLRPEIRQAFSFALVRRGFLSAADVSEEDTQAIAAALVNGWSETSVFAREWMATSPTPEVGRMFAHTLATLPWSQPEPLAFAARFATPLETIQIALNMQNMALSEHVLDMLDARRDDVFVALNGRTMSLWDRAFGPNLASWGLGVAGIVGPPGALGVLAAVGVFRVFGTLPLIWFVLVVFVVATLTRIWIQRPAKAQVFAKNVRAYRPGGAALLGAWFNRQRRLRKLKPNLAWDALVQTGWNDDGEAWQHLIMGVEADYVQRAPKRLPTEDRNVQDAFQALEFGPPKERANAARFLEEHAGKSASSIPALLDRELSLPGVPEPLILRHLELSWLSRRRITPNEFRSTWAQPPMWCGSARCLFGIYNGYDELVRVFRIDEAGELVDVNDDTFDIPGFHTIGLVHPDELTRRESDAWSEVFSDYQLISPFEQFLFESTQLPLATVSDVRPLLEAMGWLGDEEGMTFRRPLYTLDVTIYLEIDPPCAEPSPTRQIIALSFADGLHFLPPAALQLMRNSPEREVLATEWLHRLHRDVGE